MNNTDEQLAPPATSGAIPGGLLATFKVVSMGWVNSLSSIS